MTIKAAMEDKRKRWKLRRIILALEAATKSGLKKEVRNFAGALEATSLMARGTKRDAMVTITVTREEMDTFITYMHELHVSKLSLMQRAKIGLVTLLMNDKKLFGENPLDFAKREFKASKSSKADNRIQLIK